MGLDMYLYARRKMEVTPPEGRDRLYGDAADVYPLPEDLKALRDPYTGIYFEPDGIRVAVAYWRKANAVHKWFVENVQGGEDECEEFEVTREQLIELRDLCAAVLEDPSTAPERLETMPGFFFGTYGYDEWYFEYLGDTVKQIEAVLKLEDVSLSYRSSW